MSISDRLDEIRARIIRAREGRQTDRYMVLDVDAPAMLAALRAVLDLHVEHPDTGKCDECTVAPYSVHSVPWPCPTVRAVEAALGEARDDQ